MKIIMVVVFLISCTRVFLCNARAWIGCVDTVNCELSCVKAPYSAGKRFDVIPIGYPYGNDRSNCPYQAPFAHASRVEFGQPFTFGYHAVEGAVPY